MRRRTIITTALAAATTLAVAPVSGAPAKRTKVTELSCTIEAFQQGVPNPTAIHFGFVSCPKPLGSGLHYNEVTVTSKPAPGTPGAANGSFKNYYNRGTTRGTFELTIVAGSPTNLTYTGTVTYTGGTSKSSTSRAAARSRARRPTAGRTSPARSTRR